MRWWGWLMARFRRLAREGEKPDRVEKELQQLAQKIEVTQVAKAKVEQAAQITGEYDAFRPEIEEKARNLDYLKAQRDVLLRHRHESHRQSV